MTGASVGWLDDERIMLESALVSSSGLHYLYIYEFK